MVRRSVSLLALALVLACSEEDPAATNLGPTGNPTLAFDVPPPSDAPPCVQIGDDAEARAPLVMNVREFVLRPPGSCGQQVQCGHLALYTCPPRGCQDPLPHELPTFPVLNNESSVRAIELLFGKLGDPYHDGTKHADTQAPDLLHVRVDLVDDSGALEVDHDEQPLRAEHAFVTLPQCCANLALVATPSQSGTAPPSFNDGVDETECAEAGCGGCDSAIDTSTSGAFIQYDWPSPVTIGSLRLDTGSCSSDCQGGALASGEVQYWDGTDWQTAQTFADGTDDLALTLSPAIQTTRLRLYDLVAAACEGAARPAVVYEWAVYPWTGCVTP